MNIDELTNSILSDERKQLSKKIIKDYYQKIKEEEALMKNSEEIVEEILIKLLNATPVRNDGKWIVSGYISKSKHEDKNGKYKLSSDDKNALNYALEFLDKCGIPNRIDYPNSNEAVVIYFNVTLDERDEIENYLNKTHHEKILSKVKW